MRQYIGARYVPKFYEGSNGNEWNGSSIPYEALTIVTYLGNSYTSKKPVPVGVNITNTEYWAMSANYNGQVEEYRQEVKEYRQEVERYTSHRYLFIGDSFATLSNSWVDVLTNLMQLTSDDYSIIAEAGIGFVGPGVSSGKNILGLVTDFVAGTSEEELESYTDVIIQSGCNETTDDLSTRIASTYSYINEHFPNAVIKVFYSATFFNPISDRVKTLRQLKPDIRNAYAQSIRLGKNVSVFPYADTCLSWNMLTIGDGIHPGDVGSRNLALYIMEQLFGNGTYEPILYKQEYSDFKIIFRNLDSRTITVQFDSWLTASSHTFEAKSDTKIVPYDSSNPIPACPTLGQIWVLPIPAFYSNQGGTSYGTSDLFLKIDGNGDVFICNVSDSAITCNFMNTGRVCASFDMTV